MSIDVPPAPSHDAAPAVYERLAAYSSVSSEEEAPRSARGSRWVIALAIALDLLGILMLVCAISVQCAPQSALSQAVALASQTILR